AGALTPGALVSFLLLAITVAAAVGSLVSLFGSYQEAVGAAQRVFELLALQPTVAEPVHPVPLRKPLRGAVGLEHVRFRYAPALFSGSVRDNIAYARPDATDDEVHAAARAAHALEFIDRLPDGMATLVGERGIKLSGGQRQRIALARVFLKDPAVVVLDEATS